MKNKKNKVITLPISGSMVMGHSKKLEWALRDFITSMCGYYYDDEIDKSILTAYFKLDNGICVEQKVHVRKEDYICYTTLSCYVQPEDKKSIVRCIQIANIINLENDYGNFEVDVNNGDIRFKTYYRPNEEVYMESLDKLLGYPKYIINKYGKWFEDLL